MEIATKTVLGYYAGFLAEEGYASVTAYTSYLSDVSADVFAVTASDTLDGSAPANLLSFDKTNGIRTYACISNFGENDFDSTLGHSAIVKNKALVIANMVALVTNGSREGIKIDFENLFPADRHAFSRFIHDLANALHEKGLKLAISVPGSVAGFEWMENCVQYAVSVIDPAKLLIGLPAYGYDWNLTDPNQNSDFAWKEVPDILTKTGATPVWDGKTKSVTLAYTNSIGTKDGAHHVAWYEAPAGISAKTALVTKYNLAGLSMWVLGDEDLSFWQAAIAGLQ